MKDETTEKLVDIIQEYTCKLLALELQSGAGEISNCDAIKGAFSMGCEFEAGIREIMKCSSKPQR